MAWLEVAAASSAWAAGWTRQPGPLTGHMGSMRKALATAMAIVGRAGVAVGTAVELRAAQAAAAVVAPEP